jgi:hypothetical protein
MKTTSIIELTGKKLSVSNLIGELNVDTKELIQLAENFGLPCIERDGFVFIIGLDEILEFKTELNFIKLEEILQ